VQQELARRRTSSLGAITGVYPHEAEDDEHNYEADVRLKHEDLELTRIPMSVAHMGIAAPPQAGDLVMVQFLNGDLNQPVITGRLYHEDERPPLHREDELLFEHRVPGGTLNHLRFASDGTIYLQRDVTRPEDNSEARTSIKIDGETGDVEIKAGEKIVITLTNDDNIRIVADGQPVTVECDTLSVNCNRTTIDGEVEITGKVTARDNVDIDGDLKVGTGPSTTIAGNEITGA
jgi:phage baseplate assembly protein gpV